jgi:hypothetical protein
LGRNKRGSKQGRFLHKVSLIRVVVYVYAEAKYYPEF